MDYHSPRWFLKTEAILGAVIILTVIACIGFCLLISARIFKTSQRQEELNGKYKPIQFAAEQKFTKDQEKLPSIEEVNISRSDVDTKHIPRKEEIELNIKRSPIDVKPPEMKVIDLMEDDAENPIEESREATKSRFTKLEAEEPKPQGFKVEKPRDVRRKRSATSKNQNPLTKVAQSETKSKVKIKTPAELSEESLDYPDDPTFRGPVTAEEL